MREGNEGKALLSDSPASRPERCLRVSTGRLHKDTHVNASAACALRPNPTILRRAMLRRKIAYREGIER